MSHICAVSIQAICYPDPLPKGAPSTRWGQEHEGPARERYTAMISANHMNFEVSDSGLVISKELPFIAASPDGIVQCDCCGSGLVEVKCPYTHRGTPLDSASQDKKFCLEMVGSKLQLKRTRAYYLQIQTQLYVTGADFCDLCLCLFCEDGKNDLHVERIYPDCDAWKDFITKAKKFFFGCILPELVGKWYTSKGAGNRCSHSKGTTESQRLVRAQHTGMIRQIKGRSSPERLRRKSIGSIPRKIEYFLRRFPITRSTWMRTFAMLRVVCTSSADSCFLPLVNAGMWSLAPCTATSSWMSKPRSARTMSPGKRFDKN
eukprot:scpid19210/ scgid0645/ 